MNILIIPSWYPNSNNDLSGIFFKEQAEALAKQKDVSVGCIAINESSFKWIFNKNMKVFNYTESNIKNVNTISIIYPILDRFVMVKEIVRLFVFKLLFKKYLKKYGKPDIIHLHSFMFGNLALWIKKKYNIEYVVTEHSSGFANDLYSNNELLYSKQVFEKAKMCLSVSSSFSNLLNKKFKINFFYVPNSVNTNFFNNSAKKNKDIYFNFINIAYLNKNKNHKLLISSFFEAFNGYEKVKLTIVGDGPEYENLQNQIKRYNIQNQVKLYGKANREEIKDLLLESDAFVLSSKYETFGVVVIEAMACGLPVLSTKCGGPESIIENSKLGLLVENNHKESLVNGLKKMYKENYDKEYIRNYIENNFSSKAISSKLIDIYKKIVNK